ncbi:hypothetical protein IF2G_10767 [Cordyceps javanica]|nr:hypothetical protein IF2G_10767 [Cordyceps javanica]
MFDASIRLQRCQGEKWTVDSASVASPESSKLVQHQHRRKPRHPKKNVVVDVVFKPLMDRSFQ